MDDDDLQVNWIWESRLLMMVKLMLMDVKCSKLSGMSGISGLVRFLLCGRNGNELEIFIRNMNLSKSYQ